MTKWNNFKERFSLCVYLYYSVNSERQYKIKRIKRSVQNLSAKSNYSTHHPLFSGKKNINLVWSYDFFYRNPEAVITDYTASVLKIN